jgi:hypothetical protein
MKDSPAMLRPLRALETRRDVVDPPTQLLAAPCAESRARASGNQLLRRGHDAPERKAVPAHRAIVWTRKDPVRTPGKIDKPL